MIVLQVLPALRSGGVERGTVEIARALVEDGHRALVASAGGGMVAELEAAGATHVTLPLTGKSPLTIWRNAGRLARLIRTRGVEIVHARSRAPAWSAWLAAGRAGLPFVTTYHAIYNEDFPGKRRYNAVMARGERVIAISRHVARHLTERHGVDPARVRVIPRGVDAGLFDPEAVDAARRARLAEAWHLPPGEVVMLPGRLAGWKGQAVLIDALARLGRADVAGVLVGGGPEHRAAALTAQAARLGVTVHLAGACDDMPAALSLADLVISASTEPEGFGRTIVEAQAMRRPVIATDHGGAAETVEEGVTGWLVPPGDPDALAAAIGRALALGPAARAALGARARRAAQRDYSTAAMQRATLDVYREVLR